MATVIIVSGGTGTVTTICNLDELISGSDVVLLGKKTTSLVVTA